MQFVEDGDKPLYPGCTKSTKMNGLVQTFNLKAKHGLSNSCYTDILILFHTLLPDGNEVPGSVNLAKKTLSALGMKYKKIDTCPNDCILYRDLNVDSKKCLSCNASRWKLANDGSDKVGVPAKTLWYFPPISRFRKMFQLTVSAKELTWHARGRKKYGMMRHPAFSNLKNVSSKYSCWPVILITYNLPPWLCMKRKYMMPTLLILGPKQPGNDIDVYLQPLVDDLKVLWDGIEQVYDSVRGEYFKLKEQASAFDNTVEKDDAPTPLTGEETFARVQSLPKASGKGNAPAPYKGPLENRPCWKKKSVFYDLDYWKFFPVRHNLDVMHIEKNCCDAILGTLLNIPGKTKDGVASRLDMVDMGIRTDLKPTSGVKRDKLPLASWNLFVDERKIVCNSFFHMKGPSRFSSNIWNLVSVNDLKLGNLKSHDCHVIMQLLLPVAIRLVLEKPVRWMYPFERYMKVFKGMVHNRTFPEGCIAECYIVEEAVEFLEERMLPEDATIVEIPKSSRPGLLNGCKRLSAPKIVTANEKLLDIAHLCILQNCEDVQPYFKIADNEVPETIRWLVGGPNKEVPTFHGYHVNGVDFNTVERDSKRSVQNSGVFLVADAMQVASAKDKRPTTVDMDFYGRIQQIWEVDYYKFRSVVVRCPDKDLKGGGGDDDDGEVAAVDDDYYDEDDNIVVEQHPYIPIMPPVESFDNVVGDEPSSYARPGDEGIWVDN
ncbi:hypothetical protein ACLB2K_020046 [Fragaria x ananassa]